MKDLNIPALISRPRKSGLKGKPGMVSLVGAGPGDPELLTIKAYRRLQDADVVLFDALVSDAILALCHASARRVYVGKRGGQRSWTQDAIHALLLEEARAGHRVVRLKGGDPFVFGRGGEEAIFLAANGIPCEVVPGISSAISVPAAAGIPVTHRKVSTHFTVITGSSASPNGRLEVAWSQLARSGGTLVFLMPLRRLDDIVACLLDAGVEPERPTAMIARGTRDTQQVVDGTLADILSRVRAAEVQAPATLVVGDVVALRPLIASAACNEMSLWSERYVSI